MKESGPEVTLAESVAVLISDCRISTMVWEGEEPKDELLESRV